MSFTGTGCSSCGDDVGSSYTYNDRLQIEQKTNARGKVTSYTYDSNGNKQTQTEALGTALEETTSYTYTADNQIDTITKQSVANSSQQIVTSHTYDTNGNLLSRTESGFDTNGTISKTTTYTYTSYGQIATIDGPRVDVNDVITFSYYPNEVAQGLNRGNLHTVTNGLGHVTTYADYNIYGQAETITDANDLVTIRTFNTRGQVLASTTGGLTTTSSYNNAGELQSVTMPGNQTITYGYDSAGRINSITDDEGNAITYSYDSNGRKTGEEVRDPEGLLSRFMNLEYDEAGRISKVLLPGDAERTFTYDEVGNIIHMVNATGLEQSMNYDLLNRLEIAVEDVTPNSSNTGYQYDGNGNIISVTDDRGLVTQFTFDDLNRRISRTAPDTEITVYNYDEAGNVTTATDALSRSVSYSYDALNRPLSQNYDSGVINFSYDQGDNGLGRLSTISDEHGSCSFTYNNLGQLSAETRFIDGQSYLAAYDYSPTTGNLETKTYPSGTVVEYGYGANGQVDAVTVDGITVINAITRLPFGPIKTAELAPAAGALAMTRSYDQRYALTGLQIGLSTASMQLERDAEGHVTSVQGLIDPAPVDLTETYSYDPANNQLTGHGAKSYSYDAVGNMLTDGSLTFTYDGLNRLTSVESGGTTLASYGYDSAGRRIVKTVGSTTIHFLYDVYSNLIGEAYSDGTPIRDYIYLEGQLLAVKVHGTAAGLYLYVNDHLGTPQKLIRLDGTIVWQAAYLPFGKAQVMYEEVTNNMRFPGQYYDEETGLHYNWHRFYDPEIGRYISADPIGLAGGVNLYSYVGGNPVNWYDYNGLEITGRWITRPSINPWTWWIGVDMRHFVRSL